MATVAGFDKWGCFLMGHDRTSVRKGFESRSTVDRTARLLAALGRGHPSRGMPLSAISAEASVHKTTALRLLNSLEHNGLVERQSDGRFRIGLGLVDLVSAYLDDLDVVEQARSMLEQLAAETLETVHLGIPSQSEVVYVDKVESAQSLRMVSHIGTRSPLYCTALGKAILAQAGEGYLSTVIAAGLERHTTHTLATGDALRADLTAVRSRGYAIDREEYREGICCVAAEVRERRGQVVAALSVSGPSIRMDQAAQLRIGIAVRRAADEISRRLGYQPVRVSP